MEEHEFNHNDLRHNLALLRRMQELRRMHLRRTHHMIRHHRPSHNRYYRFNNNY